MILSTKEKANLRSTTYAYLSDAMLNMPEVVEVEPVRGGLLISYENGTFATLSFVVKSEKFDLEATRADYQKMVEDAAERAQKAADKQAEKARKAAERQAEKEAAKAEAED